jgi:hypothetical protein
MFIASIYSVVTVIVGSAIELIRSFENVQIYSAFSQSKYISCQCKQSSFVAFAILKYAPGIAEVVFNLWTV